MAKIITREPKNFVEQMLWKITKPNTEVKTNFYRLMAVSQEAGLGMRETLKGIAFAETNDAMKSIINEVLKDVNEWMSLGKSFGTFPHFFETYEIELINAAEKMGNLPQVLRDLSLELEANDKTNTRIIKAMTYPIGLFLFAIVAVAVLLIFVIPTVMDLYKGQEDKLPWITLFMIDASNFMQKAWYWIFGWIVGWTIVFSILYNTQILFKKNVDLAMIKIPWLKHVVINFYMYKFSKLLGDLSNAGVSPVDSLDQMRKIFSNYHYKVKMQAMKTDLENGFSFSDSVEWSELFDPVLIQIIMVGEKTWNLAPILLTMANFYQYQLGLKIDALVGMIEPVLMGFIAAMVGWIVAAIFLPIGWLMDVVGW